MRFCSRCAKNKLTNCTIVKLCFGKSVPMFMIIARLTKISNYYLYTIARWIKPKRNTTKISILITKCTLLNLDKDKKVIRGVVVSRPTFKIRYHTIGILLTFGVITPIGQILKFHYESKYCRSLKYITINRVKIYSNKVKEN